MRELKIIVLGGDRRQAALAAWLRDRGAGIYTFGVPGNGCVEDLDLTLELVDAVILPMPVSGDGVHLYSPLGPAGEAVKIRDILCRCHGKMIFGGRCSPAVNRISEELGITITDYFGFEELKIANSVLAAEGALSVAMNELSVAIRGSRSAVTGYGRIARALAPMLKALGSSVTVAARKRTDLAWAEASGYHGLRIGQIGGKSSLVKLAEGYSVIFNTVPYWLFDGNVLTALASGSRDCILIDLASAPGGVDRAAADRLGIRVIPALSLPGKYAPVSAGRMIGEVIAEQIGERCERL